MHDCYEDPLLFNLTNGIGERHRFVGKDHSRIDPLSSEEFLQAVYLVIDANRSFHENLDILMMRLETFLGLLGKEIYASCPAMVGRWNRHSNSYDFLSLCRGAGED